VKKHVTSIYAKLNVRSRAEAVAWAWEHGVMGER
nr:response regulator transcription factor [Anaerolineae bacterium]